MSVDDCDVAAQSGIFLKHFCSARRKQTVTIQSEGVQVHVSSDRSSITVSMVALVEEAPGILYMNGVAAHFL